MQNIILTIQLHKADIIFLSLLAVICKQRCKDLKIEKSKDDSSFSIRVESEAEGKILASMLEMEFKDKIKLAEVKSEDVSE